MANRSLGARGGQVRRLGSSLWLAAAGWLGLGGGVDAASTRTQTVTLQPGWNAVYLEVQPTASDPTNVFAGSTVQAVAWFRKGGLDAKYIRNPGDAPWRSEGWSVWYAPGQPDAALTDLYDIRGGQAYLIRASAATTLNLTGEARATQLEWQPNNCTFTGLPVADTQGPTFQQFFAGSAAHARHRIYRLENGAWKLVRDPATTRAKAGEAYWIQTDGASRYQGPIRLNLPGSGEIDFSRTVDSFPLQIVNTAPTPRSNVTITLAGGAGALNLVEAIQDPGALTYRRANFTGGVVSASLTGERVLRLEPDRVALTAPTNSTLLKLTDGNGFLQWIPVRALK
jgi:hypothetical protein